MIQEGETCNLLKENRSRPGSRPTQDQPYSPKLPVSVDCVPAAMSAIATSSLARIHPPLCQPPLSILLYDHLRDTLSAERLAALERLALETSKRVEDGRKQQKECRDDQASHHGQQTEPLHNAHDQVDGSTHVVCLESANEAVEFGRRGTDAEEERYLDEYNDKGEYSACC